MLILSIVITILAISSILYFNFENITLNNVYSNTLNSLEQTSKDAEIMAQTGITLISQIYNDLTISKLLYYNEPDVFEIQPAMTQLQSYSQVMQFIDSIYVYNDQINIMYVASSSEGLNRNFIQSKDTFDDKDILSIIKNYSKYKPFFPIPRKMVIQSSERSEMNCYTFLGYNWLDAGDSLRSAVVVNMSDKWLQNVISSDGENGRLPGDTFVIDPKGFVISSSSSIPMLTNLSDKAYIHTILGSNSNGYLIDNINGVKTFIAYTVSDSLGWRYIRIIPYISITKDIETMKMKTVFLSLGILVLGLLFSWIASKILYKPIEHISENLDLLEKEYRNSFYTLKQDFLRKLVLDNTELEEGDILGKFQKFRIYLGSSGTYYIAVIKIDRFSDFLNSNSQYDRNLYKFAIMNIATEICSRNFKTEAVDMNDDSLVLMLNDGVSLELFDEAALRKLIEDIQAAVLRHLELSLTITISPRVNSIARFNNLYNQTAEASLHRLFYGYGSIIFTEKIMSNEDKEYIYPTDLEKSMQDALMKGKPEEAKQLYLDIINHSEEFPISVLNSTISRLVFTVNTTLNTIQKNYSISSDPTTAILSFQLRRIETIEEINLKFFEAIDDVLSWINEKKNLKHENLINKINDVIKSAYMDPSLSIESIADTLSMSSSYIGRLYKQYTFNSILEKIIEVRMDKARELLLQTEFPIVKIAEIAEMTGFTDDTYFYKIFKKENGVTPTDYRKNNLT